MSPNGGEQSVATKVDGKTHGYFKNAYGPPEYFVGQPDSLVFLTSGIVILFLIYNQQKMTQTLFLTDEQRAIKPLFDLKKYFG